MSDYSKIDEQVNEVLATQAPTPVVPIEPTVANAEHKPNPLDEANKEIARITAERETERLAHESKLAEERLKVVKAQASKPTQKLHTAAQDVQYSQAIRAVKGLAFWNRLSIQQKADTLGCGAFVSTPIKELKRFFGSESSSFEAVRLGAQQPDLYRTYRMLAKIHGLLG